MEYHSISGFHITIIIFKPVVYPITGYYRPMPIYQYLTISLIFPKDSKTLNKYTVIYDVTAKVY